MNSQVIILKKKINYVARFLVSLIGLKLFIQLLHKLLFKDAHNIYKYKCTFKGRIYREKVKCYETELIEFVNKDFQKKSAKIIMIPGNPGLIKFYDSFLDELHRLLNREVEITGISHANHFISKKNTSVFDLDSQIDHKISFMLKEIKQNPNQKYVLIGHSIGCYMILKMIEIQKIQDKIEQVILLYPTIERMRESPNGRRMWILAKWGIRTILVLLFRFFTLMLDNEDRQILLGYLANVQNNDVKLKTVLLDLIDTNFLRNILYLFKWELKQVTKLDYDQLNDLSNQIIFYYGSTDQWTPINYVNDLKKNVNKSNIRVIVDQQKINHAFVLESSLKQARIVYSLIDDQNIQ